MPANIKQEKKAVVRQYPKKLVFKFSLFIRLLDELLIILREKLTPFTPSAIIQGIIIISLGTMLNRVKITPLNPIRSIINPDVKPVIKPLTPTKKYIRGIPIIVTPSAHNIPTNRILSIREICSISLLSTL